MQHTEPTKVFIWYAEEDRELYKKLEGHLTHLTRSRRITLAQNQEIPPGTHRNDYLQINHEKSKIILFLVSPYLIRSDVWDDAIQKAHEKQKAGQVRVIPVILKNCTGWKETFLGQLMSLPTNPKAFTQWEDQDDALTDIVQGIQKTLEELSITQEGPEDERNERGGSKPRITYQVNTHTEYVIGVDIDRSHLTLLLADRAGNKITEESSAPFTTGPGANECLERVAKELRQLLAKNHVTWDQVIGIGLATPGPLNRNLRKIISPSRNALSASQMPGWEGKDIPSEMIRRLPKKIPVHLDNDANMGALGESRYGAGRGVADMVYVKLALGIGAGLIINGQLHHGITKAAGELGHMVVKEHGERCNCGNVGCLETVAAEPAIVKDACTGISLRAFSPTTTTIPVLAGQTGKIGIAEVIKAANNGDQASQAALRNAGAWIGRALGSVINLLSPKKILLDGDVARSTHYLFNALEHSAEKSSLHVTWDEVDIDICELESPVAFGAVANVLDFISSTYS